MCCRNVLTQMSLHRWANTQRQIRPHTCSWSCLCIREKQPRRDSVGQNLISCPFPVSVSQRVCVIWVNMDGSEVSHCVTLRTVSLDCSAKDNLSLQSRLNLKIQIKSNIRLRLLLKVLRMFCLCIMTFETFCRWSFEWKEMSIQSYQLTFNMCFKHSTNL